MPIDQAFAPVIDELLTDIVPQAIQFVIAASPILLAIILWIILSDVWVRYVRAKNFLNMKYTVLELRLPKDTFKSPLAMESVLLAIHNTADGSPYAQYWKGETRPWYSLELVSVEGKVKFFIWTEDRRKGGIMAALYSQYPGIEIMEREDYAKSVHYDPKTMKVWAANMKLNKEDAYPIKTYVDYGLDKDPKEEFKVDPLVQVIEFLGSVGPNQQIWIQMIVRAHKNDQKKPGHLFKKTDLWKDRAAEIVNDILKRDPKTKVSGERDEETGFTKLPTISKGEQEIVEAIERSLQKPAFDVGIRALYIAKKEAFSTPFGVGGIIAAFKHFTTEHLNGIKQDSSTFVAKFAGVPWEDYKDFRRNREVSWALAAYKRRSYFYPPFPGKPMVLNAEELATLYHLPGSVAATPTLERVPSKKAEAPANLPV